MTTRPQRDYRALAVVASAALLLGAGFLLIQHLRHGWPFSLHHGLPVDGASASAPGRTAIARAGSAEPAVHPRVPVEIAREQLDAIGVRIERVREETISRPIRAVATVVPDESRVSHVHTRVAGWIERLHVGTTGQRVRVGEPLASIFSQELLSSQTEYLAARRAAGTGPESAVARAARGRLGVFGMTDAEIRAIEASGQPRRLVTVSAPRPGVVLHRGIAVGTAVDPSTELVTIADLSRVWVLAEVPEADIPGVAVGMPASLEFPASGRDPFEARVEFLQPTLTERTRTLGARFAVDNASGALRPGLYGTATIQTSPRRALTVPRDAIVDTGPTQHVFVLQGERRFVPRAVKLGTRFDDRIEVREGLQAGDAIVASGVFLIDSESRLRASSGGTGHSGHSSRAAPATKEPSSQKPASAQPAPGPRASTRAPEDTDAPARTGHVGH